jgi:hypothetical protein
MTFHKLPMPFQKLLNLSITMKWLYFSCLLRFIDTANCFLVMNSAKNLTLCKAVTNRFLNGQRSITVFDVEESSFLPANEILQVLGTITTVKIFSEINEALVAKINDLGGELELPETTKGYLTMSESIETVKKNLKFFSKINTNGKWFLLLLNVKKIEVESLLISAFISHKMLNILSVFSDENFDFYVSSYNPFSIDESGQRGSVWTEKLENGSMKETLSFVDKIYEKKTENLHGFVLKASVIDESRSSKLNSILNIEVFDVFKRTLNCNFNFIETRDGLFGSRLPNGTFTGFYCK